MDKKKLSVLSKHLTGAQDPLSVSTLLHAKLHPRHMVSSSAGNRPFQRMMTPTTSELTPSKRENSPESDEKRTEQKKCHLRTSLSSNRTLSTPASRISTPSRTRSRPWSDVQRHGASHLHLQLISPHGISPSKRSVFFLATTATLQPLSELFASTACGSRTISPESATTGDTAQKSHGGIKDKASGTARTPVNTELAIFDADDSTSEPRFSPLLLHHQATIPCRDKAALDASQFTNSTTVGGSARLRRNHTPAESCVTKDSSPPQALFSSQPVKTDRCSPQCQLKRPLGAVSQELAIQLFSVLLVGDTATPGASSAATFTQSESTLATLVAMATRHTAQLTVENDDQKAKATTGNMMKTTLRTRPVDSAVATTLATATTRSTLLATTQWSR